MANIAALMSAVGQLQMFSRVLRYTVMMPSAAPSNSRQLEPCAVSQTQKAVIPSDRRVATGVEEPPSSTEEPDALLARLLHARRRGIDRGRRLLRRPANLDVAHRLQRGDVVVGPRAQDVLFLGTISAR